MMATDLTGVVIVVQYKSEFNIQLELGPKLTNLPSGCPQDGVPCRTSRQK